MKTPMRLALLVVMFCTLARSSTHVAEDSQDELVPLPIKRLFEASPAALDRHAFDAECADLEPTPDVTEIAIERAPCFGGCPVYTFVLRADGSAEYLGAGTRARWAKKVGYFNYYAFRQLAHAAEEIGFFDLDDRYACSITDDSTVYVSVVKNGTRKTIAHYAPDASGPVRLLMFERFIDRAYQQVEWLDPEPTPSEQPRPARPT